MRISEIARAAGCTVRAVRHYHAAGALPEPRRRANGYRDYDLGDLAALLRVRALAEAGVALADITSGTAGYDEALSRIDARLAHLQDQRRRILALRAGGLGVPADIRAGVTELLADHNLARMENDALELMGLSGVATEATWSQLRRNFADPECRRATVDLTAAWRRLGEVRPTSEEAGELIDRVAAGLAIGLLREVPPTLRPGDLPLTAADLELSGAQARAVEVLTDRGTRSARGARGARP